MVDKFARERNKLRSCSICNILKSFLIHFHADVVIEKLSKHPGQNLCLVLVHAHKCSNACLINTTNLNRNIENRNLT